MTEVHSMLQRMNELAVQAANGTNSKESDRQAIQDEIDQLTTEIDRVAETTKFNEIYLLKGDSNGGTKNVFMKGHDAGLKGTLTDSAKSATFVMDDLKAGDKVTIAGKEYSIGSTEADVKKLIVDPGAGKSSTVKIDGTEYKLNHTGGNLEILKDGNKVTKADVGITTGTTTDPASLDEFKGLVKAGSVVEVDGKKYTVMTDANTDNIDDDDSSVITKDKAEEKIQAELTAANNIGTVDEAATVAKTAANGKTTYTITKGYATVADTLSFNLHVGADADMTNKITVDIDTMNSANLGIKGLNVTDATGTAATYAVDAISDAIAKVSSQRSALGAVQNRLEHTIDNLDNIVENTTTAESRIRDTDMAEEMVEYSKNNILAQAGQSMLAQANQATQGVLSLLQ